MKVKVRIITTMRCVVEAPEADFQARNFFLSTPLANADPDANSNTTADVNPTAYGHVNTQCQTRWPRTANPSRMVDR